MSTPELEQLLARFKVCLEHAMAPTQAQHLELMIQLHKISSRLDVLERAVNASPTQSENADSSDGMGYAECDSDC